MGLDGLELILEAEESFSISLSDGEASKIKAVGEFYNAVLAKLPSHEEKFCLFAIIFYKVRQALMSVTGKTRSEISPSTDLNDLISKKKRRDAWRRMSSLLNLRLPPLKLPRLIVNILVCSTLLTMGISYFIERKFAWYLLIPLWISFLLLVWMAHLLFETELREELQTVGEFTKGVLAKIFNKLSADTSEHYKSEVWQSVRMLVAEQLDVDIKNVTKEASFVADLGMQ